MLRSRSVAGNFRAWMATGLVVGSANVSLHSVAASPKFIPLPVPAGITNALARDIVQDLHPDGLCQTYVLAFKSMVDDRPWQTDGALVLVQFSRGRWDLWHVARNPKQPGKRAPWYEFTLTDTTQRGSKVYDHRPTATDIRDFLKLSQWTFAAEPPMRLTRGEVYADTWKSVLKFTPEYHF